MHIQVNPNDGEFYGITTEADSTAGWVYTPSTTVPHGTWEYQEQNRWPEESYSIQWPPPEDPVLKEVITLRKRIDELMEGLVADLQSLQTEVREADLTTG